MEVQRMRENRCIVCNAIIPEGLQVCPNCYKKGKVKKMEENGIKRTENGVFCEKCGNDLSAKGSHRLIAHLDGTDFYSYKFECLKCGAPIVQTFERNKGDRWFGV